MQKVDFHSHILPGMDDGAKNVETAVAMLKNLAEDGVETVVLTPHFYRRDEDIISFLKRREKAYNELCKAAEKIPDCPKLLLGAEVYFYPSLSSDPDFGKLAIEGTDYVLLELPFEHFYYNFYSSYKSFIGNCKQKLILAHIEKYLDFGNTEDEIGTVLSFGKAICQMNCSAIVKSGLFVENKAHRLIKKDFISIIGTDAHNMNSKPPLYGKAEKKIISKFGIDEFERLCQNGEMVLTNEAVCRIL